MSDDVHACGYCQPMHEIPCEACRGSGIERPAPPDPDWCQVCGGSGTDWVPAHPIGEAQA